jgi:tetratricopeptide (TPR) repeat protein
MVARQAAQRAVQILEELGDDARIAAALIELARTHSNLATVGIVAQPSAQVVRCAERALALCDRLGRDDLRAQALCYLGSGRLAQGDPRGAEDIDRAIALGAAEPLLETRVRCYVNAAGSAYRAGQLHHAERYVAAGLQLAADGEFAAGQYRLHLTAAAVSASQGDWEHAIARLRRLLNDPGQPGVMVLLARGVLARLLARQGDPQAEVVLSEALRDPVWTADSYVAGPLAIAQVELGWLTGTPVTVPQQVWDALKLAADSGHTAIQAELCVYLRRAGHDVPAPADAPGPWALSLAGPRLAAAEAWRVLGEQYEQALELVWSGDEQPRAAGMDLLKNLGAHATLARLG